MGGKGACGGGDGACHALESLDVSSQRLGNEGVACLAEGLKAEALPALKSLDLAHVEMGDEGLRRLLTGLEAQPHPFLCEELTLGTAARFSQESRKRLMAFKYRRLSNALGLLVRG